MSLDTILKIGKAFRASENGLKHFRYVRECPKETDKNSVMRVSLPMKNDFSFDFENIVEIADENIIGSETIDTKLFYLTFKTSDKDNNPIKYIFGDIYYGVEEGKDKGWYKTERKIKKTKPSKKDPNEKIEVTVNSFFEGNNAKNRFFDKILLKVDKSNPESDLLAGFRKSFENNLDMIEAILKKYTAKNIFQNILKSNQANKKLKELYEDENIPWTAIERENSLIEKLLANGKGRVFLHFDLTDASGKKYWHQYSHIVDCIRKQMREEMTVKVELDNSSNAFIFQKQLYRNLCSGDKQGDKQFPDFNNDNRYKSFFFTEEDIENLFYGIDTTEKGIYLGKDLISIVLLPNGENLTATDYERFQQIVYSKKPEEKVGEGEKIIKRGNEATFNFLDALNEVDDKVESVTSFDVVFVKKGQNIHNDLVEITNLERSFLNTVYKHIKNVKTEIYDKRSNELKLNNEPQPLSIIWSFNNVLGTGQNDKNGKVKFKANPKYQSHLLKVLPQIYTAAYTVDGLLLPAFIKNVEYSIRQGDQKYSFLKYDLEFLLSIQNTQPYKLNYMKITNSQSYMIGLLLGRLARNFAGKNSPIKSFEKNYVGNLTRRIATLSDVISLKGEIEEKLIMHEKTNFTFRDSNELVDKLKAFSGRYDKNECAFGFFESYFDRPSKKSLSDQIEAILEKGKADSANEELIEQVSSVLSKFNTQE